MCVLGGGHGFSGEPAELEGGSMFQSECTLRVCVCVCIVCVGAIGILVVTLDLGIVLAVQCCWLQQMCNMYM